MAATEDSDIPETGAVFTFGKSKFADNLPNKFWVRDDPVTQVACGDEHTTLIVASGRVFMLGTNEYGQLGLGPDLRQGVNKPSCIKSLKHEKSRLVACGRYHTIIATESGKIYAFGSNSDGQLGINNVHDLYIPRCVESLEPMRFSMLAAGSDSSMALTEEGRLFVWGGNDDGKLGLGQDVKNAPEPEELTFDHRVVCVSCGYYHTAVVTDDGKLYTMGEPDGGKLGLPENIEDTSVPHQVTGIPAQVRWVACSSSHTVALTVSGECYVFGDGVHGQLGLGTDVSSVATPTHLPLPFKVTRVFCGEDFTALLSEMGQLYTFGNGRYGKLAHGNDHFSNLYKPCHCKRFSHFSVNKVACGGCHMIVTAQLNQQNGNLASDDDADELKAGGNHLLDSLKTPGSPSLSRSLSAREKRRNELQKSFSGMNQTLPALAAHTRSPPSLSATLPAPAKLPLRTTKDSPLSQTMTPNLGLVTNGKQSPEQSSDESDHKKPEVTNRNTFKEVNSDPDGSDGDDEEDDSEREGDRTKSKKLPATDKRSVADSVNGSDDSDGRADSKAGSDSENEHKINHASGKKKEGEKLTNKEDLVEILGHTMDESDDTDNEEKLARRASSQSPGVPVAVPRKKKEDTRDHSQGEKQILHDVTKASADQEEEESSDEIKNKDLVQTPEKGKKKKNEKSEADEKEDKEEDSDKTREVKQGKKKKEKDKNKNKEEEEEVSEYEEETKPKKKKKKKKGKEANDNNKTDKKDDNETEDKTKKGKNKVDDMKMKNGSKDTATDDMKNNEKSEKDKNQPKPKPPAKRSRLCIIL